MGKELRESRLWGVWPRARFTQFRTHKSTQPSTLFSPFILWMGWVLASNPTNNNKPLALAL